MVKRVSNPDARPYIARRADFRSHSGNFYGEAHTPGRYVYSGHLSGRRPASELTYGEADYIVWSYSTPIAWHIPGEGWIVPAVTYSVSTTRHQSIVRYALNREDYSPRQLAFPWQLGLGKASADILEAIRYGHAVDRGNRRRATLQAVVDTGEAKWEGDAIVPVDGRHIRTRS